MSNQSVSLNLTYTSSDTGQDSASSKPLVKMVLHGTAGDNTTQYVRFFSPYISYNRIRASVGTVNLKSVGRTQQYENAENPFLDGSNSITLEYPADGIPTLIPDGAIVDENGNAVKYTYAFDKETATFTFNKKLVGAFYCEYTSTALILEYKPKKVSDSEVKYGRITTWVKSRVSDQTTRTTFQVPPPNTPDDFARVKFCSVIRKIIVDESGEWEYHPDFTEEEGYQYFSGDEQPKEEFMVDSVEVYMRYLKAGDLTLFPDMQGWELLRPKKNTYYKPQFIFKVMQRPSEEWAAKVYDKTDFDAEFKMAKQLFPNLIKEDG